MMMMMMVVVVVMMIMMNMKNLTKQECAGQYINRRHLKPIIEARG
jgi:hypothetical protein